MNQRSRELTKRQKKEVKGKILCRKREYRRKLKKTKSSRERRDEKKEKVDEEKRKKTKLTSAEGTLKATHIVMRADD
jgi:hypothetical protein